MGNDFVVKAASSFPPPLFELPTSQGLSLELAVTRACHLLVMDARACALCVIFAAAWRQITTPTTSTMEETLHKGNQVKFMPKVTCE